MVRLLQYEYKTNKINGLLEMMKQLFVFISNMVIKGKQFVKRDLHMITPPDSI